MMLEGDVQQNVAKQSSTFAFRLRLLWAGPILPLFCHALPGCILYVARESSGSPWDIWRDQRQVRWHISSVIPYPSPVPTEVCLSCYCGRDYQFTAASISFEAVRVKFSSVSFSFFFPPHLAWLALKILARANQIKDPVKIFKQKSCWWTTYKKVPQEFILNLYLLSI